MRIAAFELGHASLTRDGEPVLGSLDWSVPLGAVTAIVGPSGTGKSLLLLALAGRLPPGIERHGTWLLHGAPLTDREGDPRVAWVGQVRPPRAGEIRPDRTPRWQEALTSEAPVLLLDEPTVDVTESQTAELVAALRRRGRPGTTVVVTHDLAFARSVADEIGLLVDRRLEARGSVPSFFTDPPTPLAERFVKHGNCWPNAPLTPELPGSFHWVIPGQLAGMAKPGLLRDLETDLSAIAGAGVSLVVTLTSETLPGEALRAAGLSGRHFPIPDMGVPALAPAARLCRDIARSMSAGDAVAVHCHAGLGRTGLLLAAVLVWQGQSPAAAIATVRHVNGRYIQNSAQEAFIERFAEAAGHRPPVPSTGSGVC
ncbi:MAG: ATP-binding cassette domain-containing protein [Thermoanaerobaculia bacterium]|nr:ATP-binding cassette domain-containing protein [Thermoanaerobaculia bacterium]